MRRYAIILLILFWGCTPAKKLSRLNALESQIKNYGYVPFKIPRTGDGVCTLITFQKQQEAVVASKSECLPEVLVDTIYNAIPEYSYTISYNDTLGLDLQSILKDRFNLDGSYRNKRVKSIKVKLLSPFEARFTRIDLEKKVEEIKKRDSICTEKLYAKNNYLIERVFGVKGISITFQDSSFRSMILDAAFLDEITSDANVKRTFLGKSELSSSLTMLLGYRLWKFEGFPGFGQTSEQIKIIDIDATLRLRSFSK